MSTDEEEHDYDHLLKLLLIGDSAVGKSESSFVKVGRERPS